MADSEYDQRLVTEPIPKLLRVLAIPAALGFFFNTMYNVVDTWVASQISSEALAALSLSFPVFFILIALGSGMGSGITALIAHELGANNQSRATEYAVQSILFGLLLSATLSIVGYVSSPGLFSLLGADGSYLAVTLTYMQTLFLGSIFLTMSFTLNAILNALGDTTSFRNVLVISFFINLLLSPWLAFGWLGVPALDVLGIALATIITNLLGFIYLARQVAKTHLMTLQSFYHFLQPKIHPLLDIFTQGAPASLTMMTVAMGAFIITYFVSGFGAEAVAGYGTALRIEQLVLIPGIGINIAVLTLIGQNNGAKRFDRVREILSVGLRYSLYMSTVAALFIFFFSKHLIEFFTSDVSVISYGVGYLTVAAFITWAYGIIFITDSALRGLKRPLFPLVIGILRQAIVPFVLFWLVIHMTSLGINGIWYATLITVWGAALASWWYLSRTLKKIHEV